MSSASAERRTVELRPAHRDELGAFVSFEQEDDTKKFVTPYTFAEHLECFDDPDMRHLSIVEDGELVGFFLLRVEEEKVEFRRVVVTRDARGIGQQAIEALHEYCAHELKVRGVWLDVFACNARGRHIYEKLGYEVVDRQRVDGRELLIMERSV